MISCEAADFGDRTGAANPAGRLERKGKGGYTLLAAGLFWAGLAEGQVGGCSHHDTGIGEGAPALLKDKRDEK